MRLVTTLVLLLILGIQAHAQGVTFGAGVRLGAGVAASGSGGQEEVGISFDDGAELPRVVPSKEYPNTTGYTRVLVCTNTGGSTDCGGLSGYDNYYYPDNADTTERTLQQAFDDAGCSTIIDIKENQTFTGEFTWVKTGCTVTTQNIVKSRCIHDDGSVRSGCTMPERGNRVAPGDAAQMPKIRVTAENQTPFAVAKGVQYLILAGLEISAEHTTTAGANSAFALLYVGDHRDEDWSGERTDAPDHIIIDRVYAHGTAQNNVRHGITIETEETVIVDSYITEVHDSDAQATGIGCDLAYGPHLIENTYVAAASENYICGELPPGAVEGAVDLAIPSDITIRRVEFDKPASWLTGGTARWDAAYWEEEFQNHFEIKCGQRYLLESNIFRGMRGGHQHSMMIRRSDPCINGSFSTQDVTARYNKFENNEGTMSVSFSANTVSFHDNLVDDVQAGSRHFLVCSGCDDVKIKHITIASSPPLTGLLALYNNPSTVDGLEIQDNILPMEANAITTESGSIAAAAPDLVNSDNVYVDTESIGTTYAGNTHVANFTAVEFEDWNSGVDGDYCLAAGSDYNNAASDGADIGFDCLTFAAMIDGVDEGTYPVPLSLLSYSVRRQETGSLGEGFVELVNPDSSIVPGFKTRIADGNTSADDRNRAGIVGFFDLRNDPTFLHQSNDGGMMGWDYAHPAVGSVLGVSDTKAHAGTLTVLEHNNVRTRLSYVWQDSASPGSSSDLNANIFFHQFFTIYRPGKFYQRLAVENSSGETLDMDANNGADRYIQSNMNQTWADSVGEAATTGADGYGDGYNDANVGASPLDTPSPFGWQSDYPTTDTFALHSSTNHDTTNDRYTGTVTPGATEAPGGTPTYSLSAEFLMILYTDFSCGFSHRLDANWGVRTKCDDNRTVPSTGVNALVAHNMMWAGANGINTQANAALRATEYRSPPTFTATTGSGGTWDEDEGDWNGTATDNAFAGSWNGTTYYPAFEIASWTAGCPSIIRVNGVRKVRDSGFVCHVDQTNDVLLVQVLQTVTSGQVVAIP